VHLAVARRRYLGVQVLPHMLRAIVTARSAIRAAAVRHDADIIHVNTSALVVGAVVGRPNGAKVVWHVHEIVVRPRLLAGLFRILPALTGDRVIAVSDAVKDHLLAPLWLRRRVVTVRNGIPPRTPMPFPGLAGPGPLVAFVGRLNRWKGQEIFVAAAAKVASRFAEARFVVAGDPPPGEPEWAERLEAQVRRLELSSRVCQLGFVEDGAAVFDAAEIAVVPSIWPDPFPTVVLEAMRAGCAVVAADHGGAPEMIQHEATGLLVRPGDVDDTADAIGRLIDDPGLCRRLSAAARERAAVTFGVPAMLAGIKAVYTDLDR
jgi:glycosyltransferase involved in cell wall biosynthesis